MTSAAPATDVTQRPDNATEAYKAADYAAQGNGAEVNACRLLQRPEVVARVRELQAGAAAQATVTVAGLIAEAEAARALAQKLGQPGAIHRHRRQGQAIGAVGRAQRSHDPAGRCHADERRGAGADHTRWPNPALKKPANDSA